MSHKTKPDPQWAKAEAMQKRIDAARENPLLLAELMNDDDTPVVATMGVQHSVPRKGAYVPEIDTLDVETVATIDPPESGPPDEGETTIVGSDMGEHPVFTNIAAPGNAPIIPHLSDSFSSDIIDQGKPAWPDGPRTIDWPWAVEFDPQVGEILGWNWPRGEIIVVVAVPAYDNTWPWRMKAEVRPMPGEWRDAVCTNLDGSGLVLGAEWYTRWNRAYVAAAGIGTGRLSVAKGTA